MKEVEIEIRIQSERKEEQNVGRQNECSEGTGI